jgi:hypothetical protein
MNWISVKDQLPEEGQVVLGWVAYYLQPMRVLVYTSGCFARADDLTDDDFPDYWLPLPDPPKWRIHKD